MLSFHCRSRLRQRIRRSSKHTKHSGRPGMSRLLATYLVLRPTSPYVILRILTLWWTLPCVVSCGFSLWAQVNNPVALLDQENSKKFLQGSEEEKYAFHKKATDFGGIEEVSKIILTGCTDSCRRAKQPVVNAWTCRWKAKQGTIGTRY